MFGSVLVWLGFSRLANDGSFLLTDTYQHTKHFGKCYSRETTAFPLGVA